VEQNRRLVPVSYRNQSKSKGGKLPLSEKAKTRDIVGEVFGVSGNGRPVRLANGRAGELLAGMGGKGQRGGNRKSSNTVLLEDIGVTKMESPRWQRIAAIPDEQTKQ
jgi:hypothetical protein